MKRVFVWFPVVGAFSAFAWMGCGGATSAEFMSIDTDGGGTAGRGGTSVGAAGSTGTAGTTTGAGGSTGFDPGGVGTIIGATDGGLPPISVDGGGGGGIIPPEVVNGCNELCVKEATANCPNQDPLNNCIVGCRRILNNPNCTRATDNLFACEKDSAVSCDAQGKATLTNCGLEQLAAATCFLVNAQDPTLKPACTTYCANVAAANCPNDDAAGCAIGCPVVGNFIPACNMYWKEYVTCASTATLVCGQDGKAGAPACALQFLAYALCTIGGVVNTGDAGR
jgi:hypothetical protein